jgi:hypothetical protein
MFEIEPAGSFIIGDQLVHRMGYGAMQLFGPGVFGPRETARGDAAVARPLARARDRSNVIGQLARELSGRRLCAASELHSLAWRLPSAW